MPKESVNDLVVAWFGGEYTMFEACTEEPDLAWQAILELLHHELTEEQRALLAGGALETLLSWHGADFIGRVEDEARCSPRFNYLLGGVWRQEMPEEIWSRVEKARKETW